ncbi:MlaD family protein [Nocardia sp. NPDC127526]|uniref:MlaD family protein n=1 Tax=Nocardia sp. NPDC127526 TaxID=3345393 RepID=UPI003643A977
MRIRPTAVKPGSIASWAAITLVLIVGSAYLAFGVAHVDWLTRYTSATLTIPDSAGLMPRSPVLLSGIEIGQITSVRNTGSGVVVGFRVRESARIPLTSSVRIETLSALGEPYIEFRPTAAGGPYLRDGQAVDTARVQLPTSIPEFAQQVTRILDQLHPDTVKSLVATLTQGLAGSAAVVPTLARSTTLLASTLLSRTRLLQELFTDLQVHADDLDWVGPAMTEAAGPWGEFGPKINDVAVGVARVIRTGRMPEDYTTGTGLIPFLHAVTDWLERAGPDLAQLGPLLRPLTDTATAALQPLDLSSLITQALQATTDDGALRLRLTVK